jgi:methionine sulfoxide reductase heme-binding subunit
LRRPIKTLVFVACLAPLCLLLFDLGFDRLSANPIDDVTDRTGRWGLRFLLTALAVTPLRRLTGWPGLMTYRRTFGLFAFFYVVLHFLTYVVLDQFFDWGSILGDIRKRPFITVGFSSFVLMIPLAVTSTKRMIRRLGPRRWTWLHRLVYIAAVGGVAHYWWLVKADASRPMAYATVLAVLLMIRIWGAASRRMTRVERYQE